MWDTGSSRILMEWKKKYGKKSWTLFLLYIYKFIVFTPIVGIFRLDNTSVLVRFIMFRSTYLSGVFQFVLTQKFVLNAANCISVISDISGRKVDIFIFNF